MYVHLYMLSVRYTVAYKHARERRRGAKANTRADQGRKVVSGAMPQTPPLLPAAAAASARYTAQLRGVTVLQHASPSPFNPPSPFQTLCAAAAAADGDSIYVLFICIKEHVC